MPIQDYFGNTIKKRTPKKKKVIAGIYNTPTDGTKLGGGVQKNDLEEKTPSSLSASDSLQMNKSKKNKNKTVLGIYGNS